MSAALYRRLLFFPVFLAWIWMFSGCSSGKHGSVEKSTAAGTVQSTTKKADTPTEETLPDDVISEEEADEFDDCFEFYRDTITPMGFKIRYVKTDVKGLRSYYLVYEKGAKRDTIYLADITELGDCDYVPVYEGETKDYLIFSGDCSAIDCWGLTFCDKSFKKKRFELYHVCYDNIKKGIFGWTDGSLEIANRDYYVLDLHHMDTLKYTFKDEVYLDSMYLKGNEVRIVTRADWGKETKSQTGIIHLNR